MGDAACQLSFILASVPCTRTTGYGWAALGLQEKLFAPGGGVPGELKVASAPAAKS